MTGQKKDERKSLKINRGYTGHEHLDAFGIINMNGRVYDPYSSLFFSPDPYIQQPGNWFNYNRYQYALGNPFLYVDPDGEIAWVPVLIAAAIGGGVNWVANGAQFSWEGLSYFGLGAVAGGLTVAFPSGGVMLLASGGLSAGNSILNQGFNNGWGNIDYWDAASSGLLGMITAYVGGQMSMQLAKPLNSMLGNISSPLARYTLEGAIINSTTGFVLGGSFAFMNEGDFLEGGLNGLKTGLITGTITGMGNAAQYSLNNKVNFFTGKDLYPQPNYSFKLDEFGDNVTLYRGTTGSENKNGPLFMTDDPNYARSYILNGGEVVEITIPRSTIKQMEWKGFLDVTSKPQYHINGTSGIEYKFSPTVKKLIVPNLKPSGK